mmetsp:Transcript_54826/g.151122  ORF Transcript_54826/g.151122 Transcript_54826/m.151122 type:complete len:175 (+) Transcript_54826:42-566(+)|eukprot:CAMPEP_0119494614 /NCGR_PEP_ID=MMETSP1344-20130328/18503_1 /TAXON_ID=236787 /ORGANISM="Florenciella parvula, Strain CCMP2471" /LENGTH=174 /DNA_ID=CAMNT_0007530129 /DNA_START=24 /DNA_END=548 /DNA_ORIENTATION=-
MKLFACMVATMVASAGAFAPVTRAPRFMSKLASTPAGGDPLAGKVGFVFYPGMLEPTVPGVKITRARDGTNGVAYFDFDMPSFFDPAYGEPPQEAITAMRMIDEEGEISSTDVSARFMNGKPVGIDTQYVMKSAEEFERFIRFMDRFAAAAELGFTEAGQPPPAGGGKAKSQAV